LAKEALRKQRVKEQEAMAERLRVIRERQEQDAETERQTKLAIAAEKAAKRDATIQANGGYSDLQLLGFGAGLILVPLSIVGILIYMVNH
jgi:hypothetical protein